jgi:tetratricopeptide (TPR) repeat protein
MNSVETLDRAQVAAQRGDGFAALDLVRQALAAPQALGGRWAVAVKLSAELYDDDAALSAARRLWSEAPRSTATAFILARALESTGRVADAIAVLEPAALAGRLSRPELFHLSRMLMYAGRLVDAESLARRLLRDEPGNPFYWERIAQLKRFTQADSDLDALRKIQRELATAHPRARAAAAWALAKAYVDIGDDAEAAVALEAAANSRRQLVTLDLESIEKSAHASLEALTTDELESSARGETDGSHVIFILGPQRSGTTILEQVLGQHPAIAGGGELKFLALMKHALGDFTRTPIAAYVERAHRERPGTDPWADIRKRYLALGDERFGAGASFTDKLLTNHLRLAVIRRAFNGARVIRCRRDPLDIAWSCWRAHFNDESAWNSSPAWIARHIAVYERVLDAWSKRYPDWFITVNYEDLVTRPETQIPNLLQACGLADDAATRSPHESTRAVLTSSFAQVREPINAGSVGAALRFPVASRALREALDAEALAFRL